jgi:hypothetical protein
VVRAPADGDPGAGAAAEDHGEDDVVAAPGAVDRLGHGEAVASFAVRIRARAPRAGPPRRAGR